MTKIIEDKRKRKVQRASTHSSEPQMAHATDEFVIVVKLVVMQCVVQPLAL